MKTPLSQRPGRWERHLLRKRDNPLFPVDERPLTDNRLQEAQRLDHEELSAFITDFRKLVYEAVKLEPSVESEVVLEMKERLDKAYEQAAGLADDQSETREAITKLVNIIMTAVRKGAGNDQTALLELEQEEQARQAHFELLRFPLVADLLNPESPIGEAHLLPTLLSASSQDLKAAISLFDVDQLTLLCRQGEELTRLLSEVPDGARERLAELEKSLVSGMQ